MPVILLRHTRPMGAEGLCYGRSDLKLEPDFENIGARLVQDLPQATRIISSPLSRCRRLADLIGWARKQPVEVDHRIVEMDFGTWEGREWDLIDREELDAWADDFLDGRPHGGESPAMLRDRVRDALSEFSGQDRVLWVTHSGVVRATCAILGINGAWDAALGFGEWMDLTGHVMPGARA